MKTISAKWFECSVRYEKMQDDGTTKKITEKYVVDALSFTEAESRIIEEVSPYVSGEFEVVGIVPAAYSEVSFMNDGEAILSNETQKLMRAVNVGKGKEQFEKETDFDASHVDRHWYKVKLAFITLDEKTCKEKRSNVTMLVEACSLNSAANNIDTIMQGSMTDYVSVNAQETKIVDVFLAK